ncbi:MAG: methyltransferase domain-containing protein [Alphaproteobacteria bacterium]|nr:methyltransferase domain-containing protein [Alphaproteobacteria bacterium]
MTRQIGLSQARRWFAEELRVTSPIRRNESVVDAFATVPRERFLGPGPWHLLPFTRPNDPYLTPDDDPVWVYHDVLIAIDRKRGEHVVQIGAGTGYYSAVLAEIVGAEGRVVAIEHDRDLAERAEDNLSPWSQVEVVQGDGTAHDPGKVDVVVAFAGAIHPAAIWLRRLKPRGRLMMPLTGESRWGFFLKATKTGRGFKASSLGSCGFYPCIGGRDPAAGKRLQKAMANLKGAPVPVTSLHLGKPTTVDKGRVWYAGPGFWLGASKEPSRSAARSRSGASRARPRKAGP